MHKRSKNELVNTINYMSQFGSHGSPSFRESRFMGFIPIAGHFQQWGVEINGVWCAAAHLFMTVGPPDKPFYWGDDHRDTPELSVEKPWVLMFKGCDNFSCFSRFPTRDAAVDAFQAMEEVDHEDHLFYNS